MTTAVTAGLSLDEFIDGNYEHAEFFGGEVRPKPLAGLTHGRMEAQLAMVLARLFGKDRVALEANLKIGEESPCPDFIVLQSGNPELYRDFVAEPPLLCVEVVSPSQLPRELFVKCLRYLESGVPYCWVIDPAAKRAWEMSDTGEFIEVHENFRTPQTIPLQALLT